MSLTHNIYAEIRLPLQYGVTLYKEAVLRSNMSMKKPLCFL